MRPKETRPFEDPAPSTSSAPNSCGNDGLTTKDWKALTAEAAADAERSQLYWKTVLDAGAAKVVAWIAVTIPNELDDPRRA